MEPEEGITLQSYTHARTHPWVVGKIGGKALPVQLSPTQVAVLVGSFIFLLKTRGIWGHFGGVPNLVIQVAVPCVLTWCLRHLRMEGRSPGRMLLGLASYASEPKGGRAHGRGYRQPRVAHLSGTRVFVRELQDDAPALGRNPAIAALSPRRAQATGPVR
ncbi:MAG: TcpE family conjugal transfer membrane protein [Actinomycetota bacterium]|nr:TcpE family conjugal transfer membrane protein [Actinomycetota bacterium]